MFNLLLSLAYLRDLEEPRIDLVDVGLEPQVLQLQVLQIILQGLERAFLGEDLR